jgi:hypothetical protein
MNRETIYAALYTKLSAAAGFTTTSRRLKHWADVPPTDQPALFVSQRAETNNPMPPGLPPRYTFHVDVYLYANTGADSGVPPATILNPLLDAVHAALAPNYNTGKQNLGGLVEHCWIEGDTQTDEGTLGSQGVFIIPVSILVAA